MGELTGPPYELPVTLTVNGSDRLRRAAVVEPVPAPPEGLELWRRAGRWGGIGGGIGGRSQFDGGLPGVEPFGKESSTVIEPIGRQVLEASVPVEEQPISARVACAVRYDAARKYWSMELHSVKLDHEPFVGVHQRYEPGVYPAGALARSGEKD